MSGNSKVVILGAFFSFSRLHTERLMCYLSNYMGYGGGVGGMQMSVPFISKEFLIHPFSSSKSMVSTWSQVTLYGLGVTWGFKDQPPLSGSRMQPSSPVSSHPAACCESALNVEVLSRLHRSLYYWEQPHSSSCFSTLLLLANLPSLFLF